jgi:D-amino-acid dehydrogenase
MRIVVMGGGVIGVTTAYTLARSGCDVTVIERRPDVGLETSFANAGEITPSGASPWASPQLPLLAARWLLEADGPLKVRLSAGPATWRWAGRVLAQCTRERFELNRRRLVRLANYSRDRLRALRAETGLEYDAQSRGVLHLYRTPSGLDQAERDGTALQAMGVPYERLDWSGCLRAEPGLQRARVAFAGGMRFPEDETGDCWKFTQGLTALAQREGVAFALGREVQRLDVEGDRIVAAVTDSGVFEADAYVLALGSWSPNLGKALGLHIPVQPVKGYSLTLSVADPNLAPCASIMDEDRKVAVTRLGARIRVAGMAELAGFSADLPGKRLRSLKRTFNDVFPAGASADQGAFWSGLRPMTPDGAPIVGPGPLRNLHFNVGHGTLGWTMACGSAQIVTDILHGRAPDIETADLTFERFSGIRAYH